MKTFKKTKYNAKQCIDILLEDGEDQKDVDKEGEIEEWSDGDEAIRERNRAAAQKSLKTSSSSSLTSNGSTSNNRKRKLSSDTESRINIVYSIIE